MRHAPLPRRYTRLAATALALALVGGRLTLPAAAGPLYLPLGNADGVAVVDHATGEVRQVWEGLPAPHGVALTPDGNTLVVGSFAERARPMKAMPSAGKAGQGQMPHHGQQGEGGMPSDAGVTTISLLDPASGEVRQRVDLPGAVHHVAVDPSGRWAAFTHPGYGRVSVVDLQAGALAGTIATGEQPNYLLFSTDGSQLYVGNAGEGTLAVLKTGDWTVERRIRLPVGPGHMALAPSGDRLYVADAAGGVVLAVAPASGQVLAQRDLGDALHGLALAPDGKTVFVAVTGGDRLVALDATTLTPTAELKVPAPFHVTTLADSGRLMVSSTAAPVLHVWKLNNLDHVAAIQLAGIGHQTAHR